MSVADPSSGVPAVSPDAAAGAVPRAGNGTGQGTTRGGAGERWGAGLWLLLAALVVGLVRFVRLGEWSLWFDEVATWTDFHHGLDHGEITNPFGYHAIGALVGFFGAPPDEFMLRFLPALVGWLTLPAAFLLFRPLAGSRRAAAAALLLAVSSWHIYWSQTARFYTMAQFVSLIGAALVLRSYLQGGVARAMLGLLLVVLAAGFHPSAVLVLPALVLAPWIVPLVGVRLPDAGRRVLRVTTLLALVAIVLGWGWAHETLFLYGRYKGQVGDLEMHLGSVLHYVNTTGFYVTPLLFAGLLVGVWLAYARRDAAHLLVTAVVVLVLGAGVVSAVFVRVSAQYTFVVLPWIALLACVPFAGSGASEPPLARLRVAWLVLLLVPAVVNTGLYLTVRHGERPRWREAYDYVWNERGENDLVLGMDATVGEFYLDPRETWLRETRHIAWIDPFRARRPAVWARYPRRTWYVFNPEQLYGWDPARADDFRRFLREECRLMKTFLLYVESRDLSVWVYVRG